MLTQKISRADVLVHITYTYLHSRARQHYSCHLSGSRSFAYVTPAPRYLYHSQPDNECEQSSNINVPLNTRSSSNARPRLHPFQ